MKHLIVNILLLFVLVNFAFGQNRSLTGTITSGVDQQPIKGASVIIKGTNTGTTTDDNGRFTLTTNKRNGFIVVSFIGMKDAEMAISDAGNYDIHLQSKEGDLGEVVVTALGITREKKALGYAVQEIKGAELTQARDPNVLNSLSGKIAGVQITSGGSTVGSSSRITIRGNASFGNNTPLFVIDGTPINNSSTRLDGGGGVDYGNVTSDIDPNNIETMTVLKGPTAAALYGSRATHGVILITTKQGKNGKKLGVDISSSVVFNQPAIFPKFQNEYGGGYNGEEFIWKRDHPEMTYQEYAKTFAYNYADGTGAGVNDAWPINWGPRLDAGLMLDQWSTGPGSPWVSRPDNIKDFFQTGTSFEHSVAVSSQGEKASGRFSFTNSDLTGIIDNTDQTQNTLTTSLTLTPTDRLSVNANVTYLVKQSKNIPNNGYSGPIVDFAWTQRDFDMAYAKKLFKESGNKGYIFPDGDNPYYKLRSTNSLKRDRMFGNANVDYKITDWLTAVARVGIDFYNEYRKSITRAEAATNVQRNRGGQFNQTQLYNKETNMDLMLNFDKKFNDFHVDGLVGGNYRNVQFKRMFLSAPDLTVPNLFNISNVKGTPGFNNYDQEKETNSIYAAANISYKEYLFLGITGRNDWSSTLPPSAWSYFYPSVSLGVVLTDALRMRSDILSFAKIRTSWAKVGGDTGPYQLDRTYTAGTFAGVSLFSPTSTMPPIGLKPEETNSYEIGAELQFFNNRLGVDLTYYDQTTVNQILSVTTSRATGYRAKLLNAGEIENKGVEVMLSGKIITNPSGFSWNVVVNFAKNKNVVNKLYGDLQSYEIGPGFGGANVMAVPGQEWGALYGLPFVRDLKTNQIVVGSNGIPLTSNSASVLGYVNPKWIGGIQNAFRFKNLFFNFLIDVRKGSQFFSTSAWHSYPTGTYEVTTKNNVRETGLIVDGVKEDGSKNDIRVSAQDFYGGAWMWNNHEYSILDGSFVKLREMTLGYTVNVKHIQWIRGLNVSVFGRNLALLYRDKGVADLGLDPETGFGGEDAGVGMENFQVPTTRNFGVRVNVSF